MIVNQWVPAAHTGDAIGDSSRRMRAMLRALGHDSEIYALTIDDVLQGDVRPFSDPAARQGDLTIFHGPDRVCPSRPRVDRRLHHRGLTERREHLRDVGEEQPVRTDHEQLAPGELGPVRVEQERRPVKTHGRLPSAWPTLHDDQLIHRRAYDYVLFRLDRRNDVAHRTRPTTLELGEQRVRHAARTALCAVRIGEVFVERPDEATPFEREPASGIETLRIGPCRPVERRRDRRPPIDDDRIPIRVLHMAPPYEVAARIRTRPAGTGLVDATERQWGLRIR